MINIRRFDKEDAVWGHDHTILAHDIFPTSVKDVPFGQRYGYIEANSMMGGHAHEKKEVFIIFYGSGKIRIGDEYAEVGPGDAIDIPPFQWHELFSDDSGPMLWGAFFWLPEKKDTANG